MPRGHLLSSYLIPMIIRSIRCDLLDEPLLAKSAVTKLYQTDGEDLEIGWVDSFTDRQSGKNSANRGNSNSILDITKGKFGGLFKATRTQTPQSKVSISWEVCYDIAQRISDTSKPVEVQNMAAAVLSIGRHFDLDQYDAQAVISTITLHSLSLQGDSLNTAERIWSVGVLVYLRAQLSEEYRNSLQAAIPAVWTAKDLGRPRGQFLLFFLQDKDLGKAAQEMWSELPPKVETSEYGSEKASSLMKLILNCLKQPKTPKRDGFDEETNMVRLLLHLEEYHYGSYLHFTQSVKSARVQEKILESDISFQLADETLAPPFKRILKEFENLQIINEDQIPKILEILKLEQISIPQLSRLFRALNWVFNRQIAMYDYFQVRLDDYFEMVPRLFEMLTTRRFGRLDPRSFSWDSLEFLIYSDNEDHVAKQYRNALAKVLVAKSVLSENDIAPDSEHLRGLSKKEILTRMLFGIFKRVSAAKTFEHSDKVTEAILTEYTLHLIVSKMGQRTLYHRLLTFKHDPERLPTRQTVAFTMLSEQIFEFVKHHSWNDDNQFDAFQAALIDLEWQLIYVDISLPPPK
ncbi:uncharacterized protein MELLADRAFT_59782 [Melampsora larici-populina 98AG31]|uniref:Uncharacterized protein n=1 Tax=Melampsora larici-populina (strain 98AG31 / pathotype 3-4-7) TaxID=747676 RepID=F4R8R9_MELLP|nr:uncharacterized protein MELLADRAFT_59782 [Melampsora larici-populina 98AG31]EGG10853.1 hypothetical protein MELLADRAFT_59782 [Melampsora larici-populina 98AG31]